MSHNSRVQEAYYDHGKRARAAGVATKVMSHTFGLDAQLKPIAGPSKEEMNDPNIIASLNDKWAGQAWGEPDGAGADGAEEQGEGDGAPVVTNHDSGASDEEEAEDIGRNAFSSAERLVLVSLLNPNHTKPSLTKAGLEQAIKKSPELKLIWQNLIKSKGKIDAKKAEALACRTIVSSLRKDQLKREKEARKKPEK